MKRLFAYVFVAAFITAAATPALAGYSRGGGFTAPGYGARAWGMGGAATAIGADESATYWNPALLSHLGEKKLGFAYVDLVPGASAQQSYLAFAMPLKEGELDEPGLEYAQHSLGAIYGNLSLDLSDGKKYTENSLLIGYSYAPAYFVSIGASLGMLFSAGDLDNFDSKGTTFSAGIRVALTRKLSLGFVARNMFSKLMFDSGENISLERAYVLGLGYQLVDQFSLEGDFVSAYGGIARMVIGGEAKFFSELLVLRGGLSALTAGENRSVPHMGIGIHFNRIFIDYNANFDSEEAFENTHRFSLGIGL